MNVGEMAQMLESVLNPERYYQSLGKDYATAKNVNVEICKGCGGECCQRCGCDFSPDDFQEISFEYLKQQMEKGYISIENKFIVILEDIFLGQEIKESPSWMLAMAEERRVFCGQKKMDAN